MKIFVSIVSVNDENLVDTIKDCLAKALHPENIVFGVGMFYDNFPDLSFIDTQLKTIKFDKKDRSLGIVKARHSVRKLHKNEEYYLQINSNTKFSKNWDDFLIYDLESFKDKKTIISSKLFDYETNKNSSIVFDLNILNELEILMGIISEDENIIKTRSVNKTYFASEYISNDFIFARSKWIYEMDFPQYHKDAYEDVELSVITFCNGYKVVAPKSSRRLLFGNPDRTVLDIDSDNMKKEIAELLMIGKNQSFDLTNTVKSVSDFYKSCGLSKQYKKSYPYFIGGAPFGMIHGWKDSINYYNDMKERRMGAGHIL